jgi:hypothetical protein
MHVLPRFMNASQYSRLLPFDRNPTTRLRLSTLGTVVATLAIVLTLPAKAFGIELVSTRADLAGTDLVNWSSLGAIPPMAPFRVLPNTVSTQSVGGLGVTAAVTPTVVPGVTPPLLFQTSPSIIVPMMPPRGIPTNFANGDFILLTGLKPGPPPAIGNAEVRSARNWSRCPNCRR